MSATEYVMILISIVLGLGLTDVLVSAHKLFRAGRRVKWDWAAPICALIVTLLLIKTFWSAYDSKADASMTIGVFLVDFVELVLMFLLASSVLPDEIPAEGLDLKAYYDRNGAYFWGLMAAALAWSLGTALVPRIAHGANLIGLLRDRPVDVGVLVLFATLIFVRWRWWHAVVIAIALLGPVSWLSQSLGG